MMLTPIGKSASANEINNEKGARLTAHTHFNHHRYVNQA
jgi:hypothetical protein